MVTRQEALFELRKRYGPNIPVSELQKLPPPTTQQSTVASAPPQPSRPAPQDIQAKVRARHYYERSLPTPTNAVEPIKQNIIQERARVKLIQKQVQQAPDNATFKSGEKTYTKTEAIRELKKSTQSLNSYEQEVNQYNKEYGAYLKKVDEQKAKQEEFFNDVRRIKWPYSGPDNKIPGMGGQEITPDMPISHAQVIVDAEGKVTFVKPEGMPEALWQYHLALDLPSDYNPQVIDESGNVKEISRSEYVQVARDNYHSYLLEKHMELWERKNPLGYRFFSIGEFVLKPFEFGGYYIQEALGQIKPTDRYKHQAEFEVYATKKEKEQGALRFMPFYGVYSDLPTVAATYGGYGIVSKAATPVISAFPKVAFWGGQAVRGGMTVYTLSELNRMYGSYKGAKTPQRKAEVTGEFLAFLPFTGITYSQVKKGAVSVTKKASEKIFTSGYKVVSKIPSPRVKSFITKISEGKIGKQVKLWATGEEVIGRSLPLRKTKLIGGKGISSIETVEGSWNVKRTGKTQIFKGRGERIWMNKAEVKSFETKFGQAKRFKPATFKEFSMKAELNRQDVSVQNIFEINKYYKPTKKFGFRKIKTKELGLKANRFIEFGERAEPISLEKSLIEVKGKPSTLKEPYYGSMYRKTLGKAYPETPIFEEPNLKLLSKSEQLKQGYSYVKRTKDILGPKELDVIWGSEAKWMVYEPKTRPAFIMKGESVTVLQKGGKFVAPEKAPQTYGERWGVYKGLRWKYIKTKLRYEKGPIAEGKREIPRFSSRGQQILAKQEFVSPFENAPTLQKLSELEKPTLKKTTPTLRPEREVYSKKDMVRRLESTEQGYIKVPASAFKSELQLEGLAFGSLAIQKRKQLQTPSIKQIQIQQPEQIRMTLQAQSIKQAQLQKQEQKLVQKSEQILRPIPYTRLKQSVPMRTRYPIGLPKLPIGLPETRRQPRGYHAYVKGHKREIRVTKQPLLKAEAMGYGAMITDQTVSRFFKVKLSKDPAVSQPQYATRWNDLQYKFKASKGGFEELPQFAMDTTTEQQEQTPEAISTPFWVGYKKPKTLHKKGKKEFIYMKSYKSKGIKKNKGFKYMNKKGMFK